MDEMESKLGAILGNPQMMQQIMAMAQAMQNDTPKTEETPPQPTQAPHASQTMAYLPSMPDAATLQKIASIASKTGVDRNQQALLKALGPYLSRDRIAKLEKAMRAAKIAGLASTVIGSGGLSFLTGR